MNQPSFKITPEAIRSYAEAFDIPLAADEAARLATQLAGGFAGLAQLWEVDVTGCEPFVIFSVDRR